MCIRDKNEGADRENFDTFIEAFCNRIPGTTFLSYEETDQQLKESFAQIQMLAWGLILFVGLIGILNIINTVYTNIHTRVTEKMCIRDSACPGHRNLFQCLHLLFQLH